MKRRGGFASRLPQQNRGPFNRTNAICGRLLHHVRQLMGDQPSPLVRPRNKPARAKHHLVTHRVGMGIHVPRRFGGSIIRVHPYLTEIVTEARLEEAACGGVKRLAR